MPEPPSILVNLCHVDNNVITVAWQQGHVLAGNDVSYVLELDDGDAGQFRVSMSSVKQSVPHFSQLLYAMQKQ